MRRLRCDRLDGRAEFHGIGFAGACSGIAAERGIAHGLLQRPEGGQVLGGAPGDDAGGQLEEALAPEDRLAAAGP